MASDPTGLLHPFDLLGGFVEDGGDAVKHLLVGILALSACNNTPAEHNAQNIEENGEAVAENIVDNAEAVAENITDNAHAVAENVEASAENKADAVEANGQ